MTKSINSSIVNFINKYGFYFACVLCLALCLGCYWYNGHAMIISLCAVIVLFSLFCDINKIIILCSFSMLFGRLLGHNYGAIILLIALGVKCVQEIMCNRLKWKNAYIFPLIVLAYFIVVPFATNGINYVFGKNNALIIIMLAIGFEVFLLREKIDYKYVVRTLSIVFIFVCSCALIMHFGLEGFNAFKVDGVRDDRFCAFTSNANNIAMWATFIGAFYLALFLLKRIGRTEFSILFVLVSIFGVLTKSKTFIIMLGLLLIIYLVCECVRNKKIGFIQVAAFLVVIVAICFLFKDKITEFGQSFVGYKENKGVIWNITTGRSDIWIKALTAWSDNLQSIFFGVGDTFAKNIHNGYLDVLVRYGVLGFILVPIYIAYLMAMAQDKLKFSFVRAIPFIVLCLYMMVEVFSNGYIILLILSLLSFFVFKNDKILAKDFKEVKNKELGEKIGRI